MLRKEPFPYILITINFIEGKSMSTCGAHVYYSYSIVQINRGLHYL